MLHNEEAIYVIFLFLPKKHGSTGQSFFYSSGWNNKIFLHLCFITQACMDSSITVGTCQMDSIFPVRMPCTLCRKCSQWVLTDDRAQGSWNVVQPFQKGYATYAYMSQRGIIVMRAIPTVKMYLDLLWESSTEHHGLANALRWHCILLHDASNLRFKSHVQHAVSLIQDQEAK